MISGEKLKLKSNSFFTEALSVQHVSYIFEIACWQTGRLPGWGSNWFCNIDHRLCNRLYDSCTTCSYSVYIFNTVCALQEKPAKGRLFHTQKNLAELEERCEHPWRDLFLWAVLQNRQQMANYFWAMVSLDSSFSLFYLSSVWFNQ